MDRNRLIMLVVEQLQEALDEEDREEETEVTSTSPLVGAEAVISSLGLVNFITNVETELDDQFELEVTLVSEEALSRSKSPFQTCETLTDYILELAGAPSSADDG